MRRARGKAAKKRIPSIIQEVRKSTTSVVVVCHSDWTANTVTGQIDSLCSKTGQWQVIVHNPDTKKWWDRLRKTSRARCGPPKGLCHVVLVYPDEFHALDDDGDDPRQNDAIRDNHSAVELLGESSDIATVTLLNRSPTVAAAHLPWFEELERVPSISGAVADLPSLHNADLRRLWAAQDAHDLPPEKLHFDDVPRICDEWSALAWRWNGPRIGDLYRRLRSRGAVGRGRGAEGDAGASRPSNDDVEAESIRENFRPFELRRRLEERAASLWEDPKTRHAVDLVLRTGAMPDENLFGRVHSLALASASLAGGRGDKYLVVGDEKGGVPATLSAYDFATCEGCARALGRLVATTGEKCPERRFRIPLGNPMMTMSLVPALFRTGAERASMRGPYASLSQFDEVLGSCRAWEEHMALKASVIYLFQGPPGPLRNLAVQVARSALPRTWDLVLREPPEETFLRALLHPDALEAGQLLIRGEQNCGLEPLPHHFQVMARIYALRRFICTLDEPSRLAQDPDVRREIASTMRLAPEQVDATVRASATSNPLSLEECMRILQIQPTPVPAGRCKPANAAMEKNTVDTLGMLGLFLNRDRKSLTDSGRIETFPHNIQSYTTTKALVDCAMYCGAIRWLTEEDEDEEGIWTCLLCLHRWQKRLHERDAFQARKLMHPMTLNPFARDEYHDKGEWDEIMDATDGDITKLGVDFYWGKCSTEGCDRVCPAVARSGACAETDGVLLREFPETVALLDGYGEKVELRRALEALGPLGANNLVTVESLEKYFDSEEKLMYLAGRVRRRVRNCIDKSTYILPVGVICGKCAAVPEDAINDYCPYCGFGFEPVFACVHYHCPRCNKHFCKACKGIDGIHFNGVYSARDHVCWRVLGNRYHYHDKGICASCGKERPWPESHRLESAGPEICRKALLRSDHDKAGMSVQEAIEMQSSNLQAFTERYKEGVDIFVNCSHTALLGKDYCRCGANVDANKEDF